MKGKKSESVPIFSTLYKESFRNSASGPNLFDVSCQNAWTRVRRELPNHVPSGQVSHAFRHTAARHFMMNIADIWMLQRTFGH